MALRGAHDLVRPLPGGQGKAALLGDMFTILMSPYDDEWPFAGQIRVAVPPARWFFGLRLGENRVDCDPSN